jgi:histidinol dehydrogenase
VTTSVVRTLTRRAGSATEARAAATRIVEDVRRRGDAALFDLARRFDGVRLDSLEVPRATLAGALDALDRNLRRAMERSATNIARVHEAFRPRGGEVEVEPGVTVGRRCDPLSRVGVYAPGGRASYPSSVLMAAIPARVAGVGEIILASPPAEGALPSRSVLAAAALANVDRVFAVGGAGAVAALAFGTATIPRVDRIVGPGNSYVAAAKLAVVSAVAIDCPAGPSELLVIADASADPAIVAAEMIGQAEHDPFAYVAALVVGDDVAAAIERELEVLAARAERGAIVHQALESSDGVVPVGDLETALAMANEFAPEHLLLATARAESLLPRVRNAGTVLVGTSASVTFGDYMTGANHVLPTGGLARCYSGLSPLDFVRWTTYQRVTPSAASTLSADVALLAVAEGLPAHAAAARRWSSAR